MQVQLEPCRNKSVQSSWSQWSITNHQSRDHCLCPSLLAWWRLHSSHLNSLSTHCFVL